MKSTERHKLKEDEFARSMARARQTLESRQRDITLAIVAVVVVLVAVAGYAWWRQARTASANTALASAMAVHESPVIAPAAPAPGSPIPLQQPGTFPTERAKLEAALPRFLDAAERYPTTDAGIAARYHAAATLAELGRHSEAEQRYQEVIDRAGGRIYARTARLGLADVQVAQGKYDNAIAIYTELSRDSGSPLPVDGILMQLGRAYAKAGKPEDAARAFNRVVEEFPQSAYATDARREMEAARKG